MDAKSLTALEFPKIVSAIAGNCLTPYGPEVVVTISPKIDPSQIALLQRENQQMRDIVAFGDPFPLVRVEDIRPVVKTSAAPGSLVEAEEFLVVREALGLLGQLKVYPKLSRVDMPDLRRYMDAIGSFAPLKKEIERVVAEDGSVKDGASSELKRIRHAIADTRRKLIAKLSALASDRTKASAGRLEDVVTMRHDRYVVAAPSSGYRSKDGIVLDRSQTGATLFIEPPFAVEWNNELTLLQQEERREIDRILRELTARLGVDAPEILQSLVFLGELDCRHAIALFAVRIKAVAPKLSGEAIIDLVEARHPLLLYYAKDATTVVPLTISLGRDRQGVLITGPNTGGKTVAMKTLGLLAAMTQSGLPIPADPRSVVGIFHRISADIGDEQSLELSLSTFSSHITKVIQAVRAADARSLLLFDEIGAGTDPAEGSALAEAVILSVIRRGALLVVTTHYSRLKTLPLSHPELENASLEFDEQTLRPTYRLRLGIPGSSYAIEISSRLGMPEDIVQAAASMTDVSERSMATLLSKLNGELEQIRNDSVQLRERLGKAEELERLYKSRTSEFQREVGEMEKEAKREAEKIVSDSRAEIERIVREIRESQASKEAIRDAQESLKTRAKKISSTSLSGRIAGHSLDANQTSKPRGPNEPLAPGDRVYVNSLKKEGELVEILGGGKARVRLGNLLNQVPLDELRKILTPRDKPLPRDPIGLRTATAPGPEIHLRGMTVEDAREALDKFLDQAILAGLPLVYVIHGKGTGTLRRALSVYLKEHPSVEDVQIGDYNQGGLGVSVVRLR